MRNINDNDKYITGQYALNIHHHEIIDEPSGDWHGSIWDKIKVLPHKDIDYAGINCSINTFEIWDNLGIYDDTEHLRGKNIDIIENVVFVANYYRAILDMVYEGLYKYNKLYHLYCITYDFLDNDDQINYVIDKAIILKNKINTFQNKELDKWIFNELNYENIRKKGIVHGFE